MKKVPHWLVCSVLSPYRSRFIYPQRGSIFFDVDSSIVSGSIIYLGGPYLKTSSSVFNAPEAVISFFQIMYILTTCYMMGRDGNNPFVDTMPRSFKKYYDLQGQLVVKDMDLHFNKPIYGSPKDLLPIMLSITHSGRSRQGFSKFLISGSIGLCDEFRTDMSIYLIDKDIHGVKQPL